MKHMKKRVMNRYTPTFIFLLLCMIFCLISWKCTTAPDVPPDEAIRVPTKVTSYPLIDHKGVQHKYRDNFDSFLFPQHNEKLTQYCAFHFEWEDIKAVYKKDENGEWGFSYIVNKNKKSWK